MAELSKTALRALTILEILNDIEKPVSLDELTKIVGDNKTSVYRGLKTLQHRGFVAQDSDDRYYITLKLVTMAQKIISRLDLRSIARPFMKELIDLSGLSIHLAIRDGDEVVFIDKMDNREKINISFDIGRKSPLYCTSVGKVLLAYISRVEQMKILNGIELKKVTEQTITDKETLLRELEVIRQNGYAIDKEEHNPGIKCTAAPILDHAGEIKAAISITGFAAKVEEIGFEKLSEMVKKTALQISRKLGYRG